MFGSKPKLPSNDEDHHDMLSGIERKRERAQKWENLHTRSSVCSKTNRIFPTKISAMLFAVAIEEELLEWKSFWEFCRWQPASLYVFLYFLIKRERERKRKCFCFHLKIYGSNKFTWWGEWEEVQKLFRDSLFQFHADDIIGKWLSLRRHQVIIHFNGIHTHPATSLFLSSVEGGVGGCSHRDKSGNEWGLSEVIFQLHIAHSTSQFCIKINGLHCCWSLTFTSSSFITFFNQKISTWAHLLSLFSLLCVKGTLRAMLSHKVSEKAFIIMTPLNVGELLWASWEKRQHHNCLADGWRISLSLQHSSIDLD
jgi:hypothetical protein